ncbi:hypothetical protein BE04_06265 [Sorangium cellulosum]|uniref:Uncharacterized protein n=1 Tax=Sorangium cellulosum TaxID=56 RepID=A0A150SSD8_SORCE|nr:hypothetical protein BE04_06265 [Sorangium cellulosum]KYF84330.1 hypothetical protein BE18_33155 [Sorangium cellulosum]KYF95343.1 hypothetical protein BE20_45865 [Sorangium cellulosum]
MPLNFLLWNALRTSDTSHGEAGKRVSLQREAGETVLVFHADTQEFRRRFGVTHACDAIFFYKRPPAPPLLLFVELKGKEIADGAIQLRETLLAVRRELAAALRDGAPRAEQLRAVIVCSGVASPREHGRVRAEFERATSVPLLVKTVKRGTCDLRDVLR